MSSQITIIAIYNIEYCYIMFCKGNAKIFLSNAKYLCNVIYIIYLQTMTQYSNKSSNTNGELVVSTFSSNGNCSALSPKTKI